MKESLLVSACLFRIPCRYDGNFAPNSFNETELEYLQENFHLVPVCPEQLAGFPTPRIGVEIVGGDGFWVLNQQSCVQNKKGQDVTENMLRGASATLQIARIIQARWMIGQDKSPSCSTKGVYDGSFQRRLIPGFGVTSALLSLSGISVFSAEDFFEGQGCKRK